MHNWGRWVISLDVTMGVLNAHMITTPGPGQ